MGRAFTDVKNAVFAAVSSALNVGPSFESVAISTTGSVDASGVVISAGHYTGYERIHGQSQGRNSSCKNCILRGALINKSEAILLFERFLFWININSNYRI